MNNRLLFTLAFFCTAGASSLGFAQADPRLTAGQLPMIVIFPDTSGSMEYIDLGDEEYPHRDPFPGADGDGDGIDDDNLVSLYGLPGAIAGDPDVWDPGTFIDYDDGNRASGNTAFGSCIVWEPPDCGDYERPSWNAREADVPVIWMPDYKGGADLMRTRFNSYMRGNCLSDGTCAIDAPLRMHWLSQPRHVTVKEVLTGDMILLPTNDINGDVSIYNPNLFGPGCWFVPRQRDASIQPTVDQLICDGDNDFEDLPDFDEPRPHFQEVYDGQISNGLMDSLTGSAIFAVVGFDGYRERDINPNWDNPDINNELNDDIDGADNEGANSCTVLGGPRCYDLGVYKIVAPRTLQIPSRFLPELSQFSQIALRDYGYLNRDTTDTEFELSPNDNLSSNRSWMGASFSADFDDYYEPHYLGRQPIARATPVAAAMRDLYQWFAEGQSGIDTFSAGGGAFEGDDFAECRPKHVIHVSDGAPSPELGDPTLTAAFGNDPARYPYGSSEAEIDNMSRDLENKVAPVGAIFDPLYSVRVHIVGLNIGDPDAIDKMTTMAMAGNSCAGQALGANWQGPGCANGVCLVDQPAAVAASYMYLAPDGSTVPCDYPALILDRNDRDSLQGALSLLFNEIIGASAVSSRTRTVVTNRLDTDDAAFSDGGQHRVFSGVKIDGSQWWKGILNRQTQLCPDLDNPIVRELHEEVGNQVQIPPGMGPTSDNRRIFTSFNESLLSYNPVGYLGFGAPPSGNATFPMRYKFARATQYTDEFGTSYAAAVGSPLQRTRISFEYSMMYDAYLNAYPLGNVGSFNSYMNGANQAAIEDGVNNFSARIDEKAGAVNGGNLPNESGRALGGFLNSNPVLVEPPNLDLPIDSYRAFKARWADRSTMLYINTMDGLLHGLHIGEREQKVRVRDQLSENVQAPASDPIGDSEDQREAFTYIPQFLHKRLMSNRSAQPYFMDGATLVKDVRLCRRNNPSNQSPVCTDIGGPNVGPSDQWRTVLVQAGGLGNVGDSMYALDVTRSGGPIINALGNLAIEDPDPLVLWEFDRGYEKQQIATTAVDPRWTGTVAPTNIGTCLDATDFWRQPMLGLTISQPEIATILTNYVRLGTPVTEQRPYVVFGGGANIASVSGCEGEGIGYAIYVMDLQSGSIVRRFVEWTDTAGVAYPFVDNNARFTGSPALFDASPGSVATRGFIGDEEGRMFRMDFTDPNPANWEVQLFFDPNTNMVTQAERDAIPGTNGLSFGPAAFKPAVATNADRQAVVIYGLGDPSDVSTNNEAQAVISLTDQGDDKPGVLNWVLAMEEGEKLTGSPLVFNNVAYFPSYIIPAGDSCEPGLARIYGLRFDENDTASPEPFGIWQDNAEVQANAADLEIDSHMPDQRWFGPKEPTLIRGLTLTFRSPCNISGAGTSGATYSDGDDASPQLIAQTSGDDVANNLKNRYSSSGADPVDRMVLNIEKPRSTSKTMDWAVVNN